MNDIQNNSGEFLRQINVGGSPELSRICSERSSELGGALANIDRSVAAADERAQEATAASLKARHDAEIDTLAEDAGVAPEHVLSPRGEQEAIDQSRMRETALAAVYLAHQRNS